jgi:hypothetical protein
VRVRRGQHPTSIRETKVFGWSFARLIGVSLLCLPLIASMLACGDDEEPLGAVDAELIPLCQWVDQLRASALFADVTRDTLPRIGEDAAVLIAAASTFELRTISQAEMARVGVTLGNIQEAAQDERGLMTIPTYRGILAERLDGLLSDIRAEYGIAPGVAPCAA